MKNLKEQYIRYFGALNEAKATQDIEFRILMYGKRHYSFGKIKVPNFNGYRAKDGTFEIPDAMDYRGQQEQREMIFRAYLEQKLVPRKYGLKIIKIREGSNGWASVTMSGDREKFVQYIMSKDYEPNPYLSREEAESIVDTGVY